jgi:hypothetical protein
MKRILLLAVLLAIPRTAAAQVDPMVGVFELDGDYGSSLGHYRDNGNHPHDALDIKDGGYTTMGALDDANCTHWAHAMSNPYMGAQYYSVYCGFNRAGEVRRSEQQVLIDLTGGNDNKRYFTFAFRLNGVPANPADGLGAYLSQWHQAGDMPPPLRLSFTTRAGKYYFNLGIRHDVEDSSTTCHLESEAIGYLEDTDTYTTEIAPLEWHRVLVAFDPGPLIDGTGCNDCLGTSGSVTAYLMNNETGAWEIVEAPYTGRVGWAYNAVDSDGNGTKETCVHTRRSDQSFEWMVGQYWASDNLGFATEYDNIAYGKRWVSITKNHLVGYQKSVLRYSFQESSTAVADTSYVWNGGVAGDTTKDYNNDGTVMDSDGTTGTRHVTPGLSNTNAIWLDGTQYVRTPIDATDFDFGNYVTVSAWFKTIDHPTTNRGLVMIDEFSSDWKLLLYGSDNFLSFGVRHPDNTYSRADYSFPAGTYNNGQWHHVVGVFNRFSPDMRVKLYVDGDLVADAVGAFKPIWRGNDRLVVGKFTTANFFKGAIDEVQLFNYPMTDDDVYSLYLERGTP